MSSTSTTTATREQHARPSTVGTTTVTAAIGLLTVGLFLFWDARNAGSRETDWLPGAVLLTGLVVAVVLGAGGLPRALGRAELVSLASLGGLVMWALASIAWADVPGDAWSGANRALLYLAAFTLFLILPWSTSAATVVLTSYAMGTAAVAFIAVRQAGAEADRFIDGRLSFPTGYPNANAALFLSAFWVALVLSTRRSLPVLLRVAAAGAAAFLPQVAMLSQSRGSAVAFPTTAIVVLILVPGRIRTATGIAVTVAIIAFTWDTHLAVFDAAFTGGSALDPTLERSATVMAATSVGAALATLAWAVVDARSELSPKATRLLGRTAGIVAALAVVAALALAATSQPVKRVEQAWTNFTAVDATDSSRPHFSLGIGSNRHDFWRVAVSEWQTRPLTGIGADNFSVDYIRERRSVEEPAFPHSLWVMVLSQLGIVGAALFATFLVGVGLAAVPRRREDAATVALAGAALAGSVYFFVHASVDWFWEIPALGAPALALLGLAAAIRRPRTDRSGGMPLPRLAQAVIVLAAGLGIASCTLPWLSQRQIDKAVAAWRTDPPAAYDHLESARRLNPLSAKSDLVAGVIAARLDDTARMPSLFARSLERNPFSWYAQLELGLAESVSGRQQDAVAAVERAIELNPREALLQDVRRRLQNGEKISPSSLDEVFLERIESRTR